MLLLGESPPRSNRPRFFYLGNSTLFQSTVPVFVARCDYPSDMAFLSRFRDEGWFLDDFFSDPGGQPGDGLR